jgi:hypothetical protein
VSAWADVSWAAGGDLEPRFCVETGEGWQHLMRADAATDAGLDVDRAYCPVHDGPDAEVRREDRLAHPHDRDCPACGRRQWGGPDPYETCQACGHVWAEDADLGLCVYCQLPLVPGAGEEAQHPRSAGHDGRLRYFGAVAPDALHRIAQHM